MTLQEARAIAEISINKMRRGAIFSISINDSVTEEFPTGFVFYYNTNEFLATQDLSKSLAGNGPIFVRKSNGEVIILPSNRTAKRSIEMM